MKLSMAILVLAIFVFGACKEATSKEKPTMTSSNESRTTAVFAGGCYWCMDGAFEKVSGVKDVISGYAEGLTDDANSVGNVEAIKVVFDPNATSYAELLEYYWKQFDATDDGGSFHDRGPQYKSYVFYLDDNQKNLAGESKKKLEKIGVFGKPIATKIVKFTNFSPVEESEQHFYKKNPQRYYGYREASGRDRYIKKIWGEIYMKKYSKMPEQDLKSKLTSLQYEVTQRSGTERPFQNQYWDNHNEGIYVDVVSGEPLFSSKDKYDSGTGWPSFTKPIDPFFIVKITDGSHGMERVEVRSKYANSHLGHVFNDGPAPTHLRYCMNSASMRFIPKDEMSKEGYGEYTWLLK